MLKKVQQKKFSIKKKYHLDHSILKEEMKK